MVQLWRADQCCQSTGDCADSIFIQRKYKFMKVISRSLFIFLLQSIMIPDVHAQRQWVPFEKDGKCGYRDNQGTVIIKQKYILAHDFSPEGIATVIDNTGWGYINRKSVIIIRPFVFDNGPDPFQESLARFITDGKCGFLTGRVRLS